MSTHAEPIRRAHRGVAAGEGMHRPSIATLATTFVVLHALDAWVLQPQGETSLVRRIALFGVAVVLAAGSAAAGRVLPARWLAIAMLVGGMGGLVVAGPIVASRVDKLGLGGSSITGLLATVGAVTLIVVGTTMLVRMAKTRWRKLLALPIGLVLAQFVLLPAGLAVYMNNAARPQGTRTPADVGLEFENVVITSQGGIKLAAWYVESANGAVVILRHGSGSTRQNTLSHAALLADAGFGVLLTDARGHGASEGRINELGWHGPIDIMAAVDYLEARPDVTAGVGILGLSMGGEEAINAAASDERIDAVVAEGVGTSTYNDSVASGAHPVARFVNWTQYSLTDLLSDAAQPEGLKASMPLIAPRSVLLITGQPAIEKTMGPIYAHAGGSTVQLWELPDTPHTDGLKVHRAEYIQRVMGFLDAALLTGPR